MDILNFFVQNWDNIVAVIALGGAAVFGIVKFIPKWNAMTLEEKLAYIQRLLENLMPIAHNLVTDAEINYGAGTGKLKKAWVIDQLYARIPDEYKKYVTADNLAAITEKALAEAKDIWNNNESVQKFINFNQIDTEEVEDFGEYEFVD